MIITKFLNSYRFYHRGYVCSVGSASKLSLDTYSKTSNPQLIGLSAFFACKARNNHLVAHVLVQQKRLRHKSPLPHKAT